MSLQALLVHDITILTPAYATDAYGNEVKDWDNATSVATKGWVHRTSELEVGPDREAQVVTAKVFLPPDTVITGFDRVSWRGEPWEVEGPPRLAWTPRGEHHLEVPLRKVTG